MDSLNQTPVPPSPISLENGRTLWSWLKRRDFINRSLVVLAVLSLATTVASALVTLAALKKQTVVITLVPERTVTISDGIPFEDAQSLHHELALRATAALLTRGPKGFDFVELMPRLFSKQTQELAGQLRRNEDSEFSERRWEQKPIVTKIETLGVGQGEIRVTGQIIRAGNFGGQLLETSIPFSLRLTLSRNPDLLNSQRYPLIITAFTLRYETANP